MKAEHWDCDLCNLAGHTNDGFILVMCRTCNVPMIVSRSHKAEFSEGEKQQIQAMFPGRQIRFEQRQIRDHAHCHLIEE